jgi:Putative F0F1-ATPase subunit Ca2+/Mg2+ transporter
MITPGYTQCRPMPKKPWNELGRYGGVGIDLVLAILILGGIGHWLDQRYWPGHDTGMMVGGLLGVGVGIRNLVVAARRMQRDIERAEASDPEAGKWTVDEGWLHKPESRERADSDTDHASQDPPPDEPRS